MCYQWRLSNSERVQCSYPRHICGSSVLDRQLQICDDLSTSTELDCEILWKAGLTTCMDAPLLSSNKCLGTLNVAHRDNFRYTTQHAIELQCIANWIASNVHLHQQIEKLNYQASIDPLTQALNRRRFMKDIKTAINYFHLGREMFF
ncbi:GAF domain-containing protein [Vibrio fluvialis]|nr:GAF domain-containing protein [Vibrio fluvialis]